MTVRYRMAGGVATLRLDRPEARNALNAAMCDELLRACSQATVDDVKLVFVRANGPVFCAGADTKERKGMDGARTLERRMKAFAAYAALEALPMPSVAVVHGPAIGSGCEIAAACDFIVATPEACFQTPEALRGTVGATQRLAQALGIRFAKDMMFTGRRLQAAEAAGHGLVARVVEAARLEETLAEIAQAVTGAPQAALRLAKRVLDDADRQRREQALRREVEAIREQLAAGGGLGKP